MMNQTLTKAALKKMSLVKLIEQVVNCTEDASTTEITPDFEPYANEMARRLGITSVQAMMLSVFINQSDDRSIRLRDLANHFDVKTVSVLSLVDDIDELVRRKAIVRRRNGDGDVSYRVPNKTIKSVREGHLPEPDVIENLSASDWISQMAKMLQLRKNDEVDDEELEAMLEELMDKNQHLQFVKTIRGLHLDFTDLVLFLVMSLCYIDDRDDRIARCDFDDYFGGCELRYHTANLENGTHVLQDANLIEFACIEGQIENNHWCLTEHSKQDIYAELNLTKSANAARSNLTHPEDITYKSLYYNKRVSEQVEQLRSLLDKERMQNVMRRLEKNGMRKGFTCIFYGGPGTGKTETALQLAKASGRDIMLVDVPSIRSKWVGETEKNIKNLFDRYRHLAQNSELAPILLFNEADALLNKRNEGCTSSVDKMENAMQNIILQEMEKLEGIMIATTNLTGSLDPAFERRFLFKIEFDKPTPNERKHIWKSMLADLTDDQALSLAERFDFSGGQIENIARKRIIDDILHERDGIDLDAIVRSCKTEQLAKKSASKIGFAN